MGALDSFPHQLVDLTHHGIGRQVDSAGQPNFGTVWIGGYSYCKMKPRMAWAEGASAKCGSCKGCVTWHDWKTNNTRDIDIATEEPWSVGQPGPMELFGDV